jgi:peroxiredoxin Q/BCP
MASTDDAETNKKFATEHQADFPILSDVDKQVGGAYGVINPKSGRAFRWTFYIGPDGKILHIEKTGGATQTTDAGATMAAKLTELADKGLIKRKK